MVELLAIVASTSVALLAVPQVVRAFRHGTAGVAPLMYQIFAVLSFTWTSWGFSKGLYVLAIGNFTSGVCSVLILVRCYVDGRRFLEVARWVVIGGVLIVALLVRGDAELIGLAAMCLGTSMRIPQLVDVFRAPDVSGVSIPTWWLGFVGSILWASYGIAIGEIYLIVPSATNTVISGIVLFKLYRRRSVVAAPTPTTLSDAAPPPI